MVDPADQRAGLHRRHAVVGVGGRKCKRADSEFAQAAVDLRSAVDRLLAVDGKCLAVDHRPALAHHEPDAVEPVGMHNTHKI